MLEGGRISNSQLIFMLLFTVLGTAYFFLPGISALFAGRDFWMCSALAALPSLLVILVIAKLHSFYPGLSIIQYSEKITGKAAGKVIGFLFAFWLVHTSSIIIQEFGEFMNIAFMPLTPTLVFAGVITALSGLAVYYGLEVVARAAEFLFPILLILALVLLGMAAVNIRYDMLTPFLSNGVMPVLAGSLASAAWKGEVVVAAMLFPFLSNPGQARNTGIYAVLLISLLLVLNSLEVAGVYGEEAKRLLFPVLNVARDINLLNFFQRMEAILLVAWIAGLFAKLTVFYYCAVLALAQWSGLTSYRPLVMPLGVLMIALGAHNYRNVTELSNFITLTWPFYGLSLELLLPGLLLLVAVLRKKKTV